MAFLMKSDRVALITAVTWADLGDEIKHGELDSDYTSIHFGDLGGKRNYKIAKPSRDAGQTAAAALMHVYSTRDNAKLLAGKGIAMDVLRLAWLNRAFGRGGVQVEVFLG
jgi:hypothetical protein